jgi:hypothetical protein
MLETNAISGCTLFIIDGTATGSIATPTGSANGAIAGDGSMQVPGEEKPATTFVASLEDASSI